MHLKKKTYLWTNSTVLPQVKNYHHFYIFIETFSFRYELQQSEQIPRSVEQNIIVEEEIKSGAGYKVNSHEFNAIVKEEATKMKKLKKLKYDPRRRQFKQNPLRQRQLIETPPRNRNTAETLHFQIARTQLQQAIRLQACLANPAVCSLLD